MQIAKEIPKKLGISHDLSPFQKAEDRYDDIQAIETALKRNILIKVKSASKDIDYNPDEPLL